MEVAGAASVRDTAFPGGFMSSRTALLGRHPVKVEDIFQAEVIRAPVVEVFRAMTVARIIDEWGGGPAKVQARVNGRYSLWDGEMVGIIKEYEFPRVLGYTLRELSWDSTCPDSYVRWSLKELDRGTCLELRHSM